MFSTLLSAPHRALFATGTLAVMTAMLWWGAVLLGRALGQDWADASLPALLVHGHWMLYGLFAPFMAGFIFTAGPKWLAVPPPPRTHYVALVGLWGLANLALVLGQLGGGRVSQGLGHSLMTLGMLGLLASWLRCIRASRQPDRHHAWAVALAFGLGAAGALAGLGWVISGAGWAWVLMRTLALWGFLLPVFLTVSHRMLPFFSASVLQPYHPWRPYSLLLGFWLGSLGHATLTLLDWPLLCAGWDALFAGLLAYTSWRWGVRRCLRNRLLAMLQLSFAWAALALALHALAAIWPQLGSAPVHALTIGLFSTLMMGFVSRVSLGHSGQPLVATPLLWRLYLGLHGVALLRVLAEAAPQPVRNLLYVLVALGWLLIWARWGWQFLPVYMRPRADGQPG